MKCREEIMGIGSSSVIILMINILRFLFLYGAWSSIFLRQMISPYSIKFILMFQSYISKMKVSLTTKRPSCFPFISTCNAMNTKFKDFCLLSQNWHCGSTNEARVKLGLNHINMWIEFVGFLLCFQRDVWHRVLCFTLSWKPKSYFIRCDNFNHKRKKTTQNKIAILK